MIIVTKVGYRSALIRIALMTIFYSFRFISHSQMPAYERTNGSAIHMPEIIYFDDLFKQKYKQARYPDVKGSPYYMDAWQYADIVMKDGKQFNHVKLKLNFFSQEVIFKSEQDKEITLKDGILKRILIYDTLETGYGLTHLFLSGIPMVEKDTSWPIFSVMTEGKATLLNLTNKRIVNMSDALMPGSDKEFVPTETLYVFHNGELKKCEKSNDFYSTLFADKKAEVDAFIKTNKLKCKTLKEITQVVEYYNTL